MGIMSFCDYRFIYVLMPLTVLIFRFTPKSLRRPFILLTGLLYFGFSNCFAIPDSLVLPAVIIITWLCGYLMSVLPQHKNLLAMTFTAIPIAGLLFFKYNFGRLPFGTGIITLLSVSFTVDLYFSGKKCRDILSIGTYLSFFPVMQCGPLMKYSGFSAQQKNSCASLENIADGLRRFILGFAMKILLAITV